MKNLNLKSHNEAAYLKIKEAFNSSNKACVVHATGTGKSFIIAATANDYDNVLILAPNNYVLGELDKIVGSNCKLMTYSKLSTIEDMSEIKFDLIALDEFHRTGAEVWGEAVKRLIESNPNSKILGTTATDIRYLDNERNMADEMFDGNVVSRLTLPMAWSEGILKVPVYVTGLYTFDNISKEYQEKIMKSNRLSDEEKAVSLSELNKIKLDWETGNGTKDIIKKYINPNSKRIIVFCDSIKNIKSMKESVKGWIEYSGLKVNRIFTVNSKNKNSEKEMEKFETDGYDGVNIMMSVNMLNEGIHVPKVDSVILLRSTVSKIVYLQQIGRCMSLEDKKTAPVIFDLVDNLNNTSKELNYLKDELDKIEYMKYQKQGITTYKTISFNIIDTLINSRDLIENLSNNIKTYSFEERLEEMKEFVKVNGRYPKQSEGSLGIWRNTMRCNKSTESQRKAILEEFPDFFEDRQDSFNKKLNEMKEFVRINGRYPKKLEGSLGRWRRNMRSKSTESQRKEILKIFPDFFEDIRISFEERLEEMKEFVKVNGRYPKKLESSLGLWRRDMRCNKSTESQREAILEIFPDFFDDRKEDIFNDRLDEMKEFVRVNGRYPKKLEGSLGNWRSKVRCYSTKSQRKEILKVFPDFFDNINNHFSFEERLEEMKEFVKVNGRYPKQREGSLGLWRRDMRCNKSTESQRKEILKIFPDFFDKEDPFNDKLEEMKEFVRVNGRYPKKLESSLGIWRRNMRSKSTESQRKSILEVFPDFFD